MTRSIPRTTDRCQCTNLNGKRCKNARLCNSLYCGRHERCGENFVTCRAQRVRCKLPCGSTVVAPAVVLDKTSVVASGNTTPFAVCLSKDYKSCPCIQVDGQLCGRPVWCAGERYCGLHRSCARAQGCDKRIAEAGACSGAGVAAVVKVTEPQLPKPSAPPAPPPTPPKSRSGSLSSATTDDTTYDYSSLGDDESLVGGAGIVAGGSFNRGSFSSVKSLGFASRKYDSGLGMVFSNRCGVYKKRSPKKKSRRSKKKSGSKKKKRVTKRK
jgi:hypothetical protein